MDLIPIEQIERSPLLRDLPRQWPTLEEQEFAEDTEIITPVLLRQVARLPHPRYEILADESSWHIAQRLARDRVPAVVLENITDSEAKALARLRAGLRDDLLGWASRAQVYIQKRTEETGQRFSIRRAAAELGVSHSKLSRALRYSQTLTPEAFEALKQRQISAGHANVLVTLLPKTQWQLLRRILRGQWSVRATEANVRAERTSAPSPVTALQRPSELDRIERDLAEQIGQPVEISDYRDGAGSLRLQFHSLDELQGLLERLGYSEEM